MLSTACKRVVPDYELALERMILQESRAVDLVVPYTSLFATMAAISLRVKIELHWEWCASVLAESEYHLLSMEATSRGENGGAR